MIKKIHSHLKENVKYIVIVFIGSTVHVENTVLLKILPRKRDATSAQLRKNIHTTLEHGIYKPYSPPTQRHGSELND